MPSSENSRAFAGEILVSDVENGILVQQGNEAYVARNWCLTPKTVELIETAIESGLGCMIRHDHPRRNSRWPNKRGVVYLAFSPSPSGQWSVAIDTVNSSRDDYGFAVFNGKYQAQFLSAGIPFKFEGRNKGAGHLVVARPDVIKTLLALAHFDHSVLALNRSPHDGEGFTTEYVLQRELLLNWDKTPWADRYDVVQDEFPVDGGLTSRRIDVLARDRNSGDWLVIELKRAEASASAVDQVAGYLRALARRDDFANGKLEGALIAERIPENLKNTARSEGIALYEAKWPFCLTEV